MKLEKLAHFQSELTFFVKQSPAHRRIYAALVGWGSGWVGELKPFRQHFISIHSLFVD